MTWRIRPVTIRYVLHRRIRNANQRRAAGTFNNSIGAERRYSPVVDSNCRKGGCAEVRGAS